MDKKMMMLAGIVVVIIAGVIIFVASTPSKEPNQDMNISTTIAEAAEFSSAVQAIALEDGLIPIEGFDAFLLVGKVSGLEESDFEGVESFEGIYNLENGKLMYERTQGNPVTSAETTISKEGYMTLLNNLKARLGVDSSDEVLKVLSSK